MRETERICSVCGAILTEENTREFDGRLMCADCLRERTIVCDCCGERVWRDNAESDSYTGAGEMISVGGVNYEIESTDHSFKDGQHYNKMELKKVG